MFLAKAKYLLGSHPLFCRQSSGIMRLETTNASSHVRASTNVLRRAVRLAGTNLAGRVLCIPFFAANMNSCIIRPTVQRIRGECGCMHNFERDCTGIPRVVWNELFRYAPNFISFESHAPSTRSVLRKKIEAEIFFLRQEDGNGRPKS